MIEVPPELKEIIDTLQPPLIEGRIATCHEVLSANPRPLPTEGPWYETLVKFYQGSRWDDAVRDQRGARPSLVINRIHPIVHSILAASIEAKEEVTEEQRVQLILFMTSKHMDAQRVLNYWQSVLVERALLGSHTPIICTVKDGKMWVDPERIPV